MSEFNPADDGITHINIYSKAKTQLGRYLSNFHYYPFTHPKHGKFHSIEGLWYWLQTKDERLRQLSGFGAKKLGRELVQKPCSHESWFYKDIVLAIRIKMTEFVELRELIEKNNLPFAHYYTKINETGDEVAIKAPSKHDWVVQEIEGIASEIKDEPVVGRLL